MRRVLVTGWPSFLHGEATAGDVLAMDAAVTALADAGAAVECAWSPNFRPGGRTLDDAPPERYDDLVFVCGPAHGPQVRGLHERYARCRRAAVGVSVIDPADPAVTGFHILLPRDTPAAGAARRDLSAGAATRDVPVVGVVLAPGQAEYGQRRRHDRVAAALTGWVADQDCAPLPLDTRLATDDWRLCATAGQYESVVRRLDLVVTTRLHGLVLALKNGVPALAADPVAGGAKVAAQARAWDWPVLTCTGVEDGPPVPERDLRALWAWCRSPDARAAARTRATRAPSDLLDAAVTALDLR